MTTYFDITDIVAHAWSNGSVTGIQRGVIRIISALIDEHRDVRGLLKHPWSGAFCSVDLSFMGTSYDFSAKDFIYRLGLPTGKELWMVRKLAKYRRRPLKRYINSTLAHCRWALSPRLRATYPAQDRGNRNPAENRISLLHLTSRDTIAALGAGWGTDYVAVHELAARMGARTITLVYDIIPLSHPHFLHHSSTSERFETWLRYAAQHSDILATISHFTARELEAQLCAWAQTSGNPAFNRPVSVVQFPHEFQSAKRMISGNYVLCVGTLEIRKNIPALVQAWRLLENELGDACPTLVLAGGRGWGVDLEDIANGKIRIIERPDDRELEALYQECLFTVYPSVFEGWGLPVGESLWFGKRVLCARAASMPEVGGEYADYFDLDVPQSLYDALVNMIKHPTPLPSDIRSRLRTWRDTALDLAQEIANESHPNNWKAAE